MYTSMAEEGQFLISSPPQLQPSNDATITVRKDFIEIWIWDSFQQEEYDMFQFQYDIFGSELSLVI